MIIVDASVAVKWVIDEPGRASALLVRNLSARLIAPDLMLAEFANVMRRKFQRGEITSEQIKAGISFVREAVEEFIPTEHLVGDALILAQDLDHSSYDCMYLACALSRGALLTADGKFAKKAQSSGYGAFVFELDDLASGRMEAALAPRLVGNAVLAEIDRLTPLIKKTFDYLWTRSEGKKLGETVIRSTSSHKPGLSSPAYVALARKLRELAPEQIAILLALGWLGRSYHNGSDWGFLLANAKSGSLAHEFKHHEAYIMAQMTTVPLGWSKLQNHFDLTD